MRKTSAILILFSAGLVGCGNGFTHEKLAEETIALFDKLSDVLEKAADAESARPKLEETLKNVKELRNKADSLETLSLEDEKKIKSTTLPRMERAMTRYKNACIHYAKRDPAGVKTLEPLFKDLGN